MSNYAVVNDRGRRFRVEPGIEIWVDNLRKAEPGSKIVFDNVELISGDGGVQVGTPTLKGAKVLGVVKGEKLGKKIVVFKYKRRKSQRRAWGARDHFTRVAIEEIQGA
jgi:large subunit ribosomal protein L21